MSRKTSKKNSPDKQPAEPEAATEKAKSNGQKEVLDAREVDQRIAKALRAVAQGVQGYYGLNVIGAEIESVAKRLEDGKLK